MLTCQQEDWLALDRPTDRPTGRAGATHDAEPERGGNAVELGLLDAALRKVHAAGEEHQADHHEEHEQEQLLDAGAERLAQDLQSARVPAELEHAKDAHEPEDAQHGERHGRVVGPARALRRLAVRHGLLSSLSCLVFPRRQK